GSFADDRGESSRWIGSIRGPLGNPLYTLEGTAPVSQLVAAAFARGLQERGLLADPAGGVYLLSGRIEELGGNRYVRSEARARIRVMVTERQTGRELFANTYTAVNEKPGALAVGGDATSGIEELRGLVADTLHQVAAQALDDPNLRAALRAAP
ncbi:MAG: hypothetical protein QOD06_2436, partial [Candidatus Binatota bacterium]|nr:hypothetical protein [Candidatus Binatota bacterium]